MGMLLPSGPQVKHAWCVYMDSDSPGTCQAEGTGAPPADSFDVEGGQSTYEHMSHSLTRCTRAPHVYTHFTSCAHLPAHSSGVRASLAKGLGKPDRPIDLISFANEPSTDTQAYVAKTVDGTDAIMAVRGLCFL